MTVIYMLRMYYTVERCSPNGRPHRTKSAFGQPEIIMGGHNAASRILHAAAIAAERQRTQSVPRLLGAFVNDDAANETTMQQAAK